MHPSADDGDLTFDELVVVARSLIDIAEISTRAVVAAALILQRGG